MTITNVGIRRFRRPDQNPEPLPDDGTWRFSRLGRSDRAAVPRKSLSVPLLAGPFERRSIRIRPTALTPIDFFLPAALSGMADPQAEGRFRMSMKVSLIVVQGKPEGKVIPLVTPRFRIGRGEGCHLRPNNEQVSRNHSEVELTDEGVILRDLGSRNGTYLNNQRLEPNRDHVLKNKDLVQVGPLTFAVSIQGVEVAATPSSPDKAERALAKGASLDDLSNDDIDSWLVTDKDSVAPPERPSGVYTGDTMTFSSFKEGSKSDHQVPAGAGAEAGPEAAEPAVEATEPEPQAVSELPPDDLVYDKLDDDVDPDADAETAPAEEFIDESNPFFAKKEAGAEPQSAEAKKKDDGDSSQAAEDILRKMMERRKATR